MKFLVVFKLPQNPMLSTVWWSPPSRSKCIPWPPWWFAIEGGDIGPCGLHFVEATQNSMIRVDGVRNPAPPVPVFCKKKTWNRGGGCYEFWTETFSKMKGPRLVSKNQNSHEDKCSNRNGSWGLRALGRDCQWNVQFEAFSSGKGGHSQSMVTGSSLLLNFG